MIPFWNGEKEYQYFATNIFQAKNVIFFAFWPKNLKGWSDNIETFHKGKSGVLEKKILENEKFITAALHAQIGFHEIWLITEQHPRSANQWQPGFSNIYYLKQFMPKKMGAEVLILPNS